MIYWIEAAPNPWARAAAIIILGAIYYINAPDGPQAYWMGGYGACVGSDSDRLYE